MSEFSLFLGRPYDYWLELDHKVDLLDRETGDIVRELLVENRKLKRKVEAMKKALEA